MGTGEFWLWTILFVFTGYLFVKIFCVCFLDSKKNTTHLYLLQSNKIKRDETINMDYVTYVSVISSHNDTIN